MAVALVNYNMPRNRELTFIWERMNKLTLPLQRVPIIREVYRLACQQVIFVEALNPVCPSPAQTWYQKPKARCETLHQIQSIVRYIVHWHSHDTCDAPPNPTIGAHSSLFLHFHLAWHGCALHIEKGYNSKWAVWWISHYVDELGGSRDNFQECARKICNDPGSLTLVVLLLLCHRYV